MQKKKEKLLNKIVKKDYNNELEKVLEEKNFGENEKNILLNILYKLEAAYKDYECVKRNVETKEEIIERIIEIVKNDCNKIILEKPTTSENIVLKEQNFIINKEEKKIISYPIERDVLYCLAMLGKQEKIIKDKYYFIDKTISNTINIGNSIEMVEALRDFNGYSWTTVKKEIENIEYNIIYQNLRMLVGNKFLNKWCYNRECLIDYMEEFESKLLENYGIKHFKKIIELIDDLSVILEIKFKTSIYDMMIDNKDAVKKQLNDTKNMAGFIEETTKQKKEINTQICKIDEILNDKELIKKEYEIRNEKLPLEKKIFSIRVLTDIMIREREKNIEQLEKLNDLIHPKTFMEFKKELDKKERYLKFLESDDIDEILSEKILKLQQEFLNCYKIRIYKAEEKKDILNLIYEFRYYCKIPYNNDINIENVNELKKSISEIQNQLIKKSIDTKIINEFSKNEEINYQVYKYMFQTRIINLENLNIKLKKENEKYLEEIYDEKILDKSIELNFKNIENLEELNTRLDKNFEIFV